MVPDNQTKITLAFIFWDAANTKVLFEETNSGEYRIPRFELHALESISDQIRFIQESFCLQPLNNLQPRFLEVLLTVTDFSVCATFPIYCMVHSPPDRVIDPPGMRWKDILPISEDRSIFTKSYALNSYFTVDEERYERCSAHWLQAMMAGDGFKTKHLNGGLLLA